MLLSFKNVIEPSAIGVIYTDSNGKRHRALVRPKGEVILSAGAIGSPQLLLLSGVGPRSYLASLQIPVVHPQPTVGKFMFDNPLNGIRIIFPFPGEISPIQTVGIAKDYYIEGISYNLANSSIRPPFRLFPNFSFPANLSSGILAEKTPGPDRKSVV